jgi:predicted enzyme related to lactoylglutathione lyase
MLQHAGIEVAPEEIERAVEFFTLLGFARVHPPQSLAADFTWVEKDGTQIHLMHTDEPTASRRGHLAIVVEDFDMALARLQEHGFEVERSREHWGAPRALASCPGGNRIELMSSPPPRQA